MKKKSFRRPKIINSKAFGTIIRNNRGNSVITLGAQFCNWYLRCYWNEKYYDLEKNGEAFLLQALAKHFGESSRVIVFDVGANKGSYSKAVRKKMPKSTIHCFEIVENTRYTLRQKLGGLKNIHIADCGLSNSASSMEITFDHENDTEAREFFPLLEKRRHVVTCEVMTGDRYMAEHGVDHIDLLKIDTEGHELKVLEGLKTALDHTRVCVIQFEYGSTWIVPSHFLHEAYSLLGSSGFVLGRLYPNGVLFKPYNRLEDEHFRMGNYVAVHQACTPLIDSLRIDPGR